MREYIAFEKENVSSYVKSLVWIEKLNVWNKRNKIVDFYEIIFEYELVRELEDLLKI